MLERRFAGEVLLTTQGRDEVDRLVGTAAVVWSLLDEPRSMEGLVDALIEGYGADRAKVEDDVRALFHDLSARGYAEGEDA